LKSPAQCHTLDIEKDNVCNGIQIKRMLCSSFKQKPPFNLLNVTRRNACNL